MRPTPVLLAVLLLAACASDPPPVPRGFGPGSGPPPGGPPSHWSGAGAARGCPRLFSSPHGEPFRAQDGDAACPMRVWFDQADANHDGALTRAEFRQDALRFFRTLDVNNDGVIGPAELKRYEQVVFPEISFGERPQAALESGVLRVVYGGQIGGGAMGGQPGGGGGSGRGRHGGGEESDHDRGVYGSGDPSSQGAGRFGLLDEPEPVTAADLNFDGRVSETEFATRADQRFDTLDVAQTGRLTYADLLLILPKGAGGRGRARTRPDA